MKTAVIAVVVMVATTILAQTDPFGDLKAAYARKGKENVEAYGKALAASLTALKAAGDLDGYLAVDSERKRFEAEKTVAPTNTYPVVTKAFMAYEAASLVTVKAYVAALDELTKRLVKEGNLDRAKAVREERDRAAFEMADLEAKAPKVEAVVAADTNAPVKGTNDIPKPVKTVKLEIIKATYGADSRMADVTAKLNGMINNKGRIEIDVTTGGLVYDSLFGDPAPWAVKTLTVVYRHNGREKKVSVSSGKSLSIP